MRLITIFSKREHAFSSNGVFYSEEQMNNLDVTFGKYDNSMNFVFGLTGGDIDSPDFDILNNPYVRFVGLERTPPRLF